MARHNYAAFARDDVSDAKRGYPDFDLRDYAARRGLEYLDRMTVAGFRAAMPGEDDWQRNVLHGMLPGDGYGVLLHEGLAVDWSERGPAWGGPFHGVRVGTVGGRPFRDALLNLIPFGDVLGSSPEFPPARVPCTVAAVRVPEARGVLPTLKIDRGRRTPPYDFGRPLELGGCRFQSQADPPSGILEALSEPGLLEDDGAALFQVVGWYGLLLVRRNGYVRDPDMLDRLATTASVLAERLRRATDRLNDPQPFDVTLPPPAWTQAQRAASIDRALDAWPAWGLGTARPRGLSLEDPRAYHRAFPRVPVPGIAQVVMHGEVPPFGEARIVIHLEERSARPAIVVPAPDGFGTTPPGGLRFSDRQARVEVSDGLMAIWSTTSYWGSAMAGDLDEFLARAADVAREAASLPTTIRL